MLTHVTRVWSLYITMILCIMVVAPGVALAANLPGTKLVEGICDPSADPYQDAQKTNPRERSCVGQGITHETFRVEVEWDFGSGWDGSRLMRAGDTYQTSGIPSVGGLPNMDLVVLEARREGDKVCTYAKILGLVKFGVSRDTDDEASHVGLPSHCLYLPRPRTPLRPPEWNPLISPVCTDFNKAFSHRANTQNPADMPFMAAIVQCVEDTMMNIFLQKDIRTQKTFFDVVQERLKDFVLGLMTLYIIVIGLRVLIEGKFFSKADMQWYIIRFGLVLWFAAGPGIRDVTPMMLGAMHDLSNVVLEASSGKGLGGEEALELVADAREEYRDAETHLLGQRSVLSTTITAFNQGTATELQVSMAQDQVGLAEIQLNEKSEILNDRLAIANSYGYDYCDYSDKDYTFTDEDPSTGLPRVREAPSMRMWDLVDCKISRYFGLGLFAGAPQAPKMVVIGLTSLLTRAMGIPIFVLSVTFTVFLAMLIVRIVHVYIVAIVGLSILLFFGPLVVPTMLFEYTRTIFDKWIKQVVSYTLQPVFLFAFLAFIFAGFDMVIYEDNYSFYQEGDPILVEEPTKLFQIQEDGNGNCQDQKTVGCIMQQVEMDTVFEIFGLSFLYPKFDGTGEEWVFTIGLLKLLLVSVIGYAVLGQVTELSAKLTDAAGGGGGGAAGAITDADGNAATPFKSPLQVAMTASKTTKPIIRTALKPVKTVLGHTRDAAVKEAGGKDSKKGGGVGDSNDSSGGGGGKLAAAAGAAGDAIKVTKGVTRGSAKLGKQVAEGLGKSVVKMADDPKKGFAHAGKTLAKAGYKIAKVAARMATYVVANTLKDAGRAVWNSKLMAPARFLNRRRKQVVRAYKRGKLAHKERQLSRAAKQQDKMEKDAEKLARSLAGKEGVASEKPGAARDILSGSLDEKRKEFETLKGDKADKEAQASGEQDASSLKTLGKEGQVKDKKAVEERMGREDLARARSEEQARGTEKIERAQARTDDAFAPGGHGYKAISTPRYSLESARALMVTYDTIRASEKEALKMLKEDLQVAIEHQTEIKGLRDELNKAEEESLRLAREGFDADMADDKAKAKQINMQSRAQQRIIRMHRDNLEEAKSRAQPSFALVEKALSVSSHLTNMREAYEKEIHTVADRLRRNTSSVSTGDVVISFGGRSSGNDGGNDDA